jgi:hypothetical protein
MSATSRGIRNCVFSAVNAILIISICISLISCEKQDYIVMGDHPKNNERMYQSSFILNEETIILDEDLLTNTGHVSYPTIRLIAGEYEYDSTIGLYGGYEIEVTFNN